jgi:hypothetical protein
MVRREKRREEEPPDQYITTSAVTLQKYLIMDSEIIYAPTFMAQYVKKARAEILCSEFHAQYTYFLMIFMCLWAVSGRHVHMLQIQTYRHKVKRTANNTAQGYKMSH